VRIGPKIKRLRQQRRLRQTDAAAQIGCSQPALSMIESGKADPSLDMLRRICDVLDLRLVVDVVDRAAAEGSYTGPASVVQVAEGFAELDADQQGVAARAVALLPHLPLGHRQVLTEMLGDWERTYAPQEGDE